MRRKLVTDDLFESKALLRGAAAAAMHNKTELIKRWLALHLLEAETETKVCFWSCVWNIWHVTDEDGGSLQIRNLIINVLTQFVSRK